MITAKQKDQQSKSVRKDDVGEKKQDQEVELEANGKSESKDTDTEDERLKMLAAKLEAVKKRRNDAQNKK